MQIALISIAAATCVAVNGCTPSADAGPGQPAAAGHSDHTAGAEKSSATAVSFGNNLKLSVAASERERLRRFYRDVLGCQLESNGPVDFIGFANDVWFGVLYSDTAAAVLDDAEAQKAAWLEIRTAQPDQLKTKILAFGLKQIPGKGKDMFYFQAPGGQVFRLAPSDMVNGWGRKQ